MQAPLISESFKLPPNVSIDKLEISKFFYEAINE